jgi:hypothetical protein
VESQLYDRNRPSLTLPAALIGTLDVFAAPHNARMFDLALVAVHAVFSRLCAELARDTARPFAHMNERTHRPQLPASDRTAEWFVPKFGPPKFRVFVGLLFLPYTGMVLAYTVIGATLAPRIHWDRVGALVVVYFLALGISAHAFDALGSRTLKPWGRHFLPRELWALGICSLAGAYAIGTYYMVAFSPWLWPIAILEGFFVFAYNLEWFAGRFHTDGWFAFSWGALPVLAGYVLQTNDYALSPAIVAIAAGMFSLVEIKASRRYKELKRSADGISGPVQICLEGILKCISAGVVLLGSGLAVWRWIG